MKATLTLISKAQPMGQYQPTEIDPRKAQADILIEYTNGGSYTIKLQKPVDLGSKRGIKQQYANGMVEVTETKLAQLRKVYNVQPNF